MNTLHIKQAFRTLRRNRVYAFINLASLGIAGAFALLVAVYAVHAIRTDTYSPALKNIYRIETTKLWEKPDTTKKKGFFDWLAADADAQRQLVTPLVLAPELKQNFSEIEGVCRLQTEYEPVVIAGDKRFKEGDQKVAWVDKNFFSLLGLPLLTAESEGAFPGVHNAVITERAAKKYFGTENPVGKVLRLRREEERLYTISAVARDFPANSSMQFDVLFCLEGQSDYAERLAGGINQSSFLTLVKLKPQTDMVSFRRKLAAFGETYFSEWVESGRKFHPEEKELAVNLSLRPFSESHFNVSSPWFHFTDLKSLYQLLLLALITVGIACLNYVLLSLSRVALRSQEAGVRKTVGAGWRHIVSLFLTETFVLVALSMATGFVLAVLALPFFNRLAGVNILPSEIVNLRFAGIALGLATVLTLLAGLYPAIKMAGFKPLNVLSKFGTYKLHPTLSKVFITLQYTACIVLIVFAIVIARQLRFVNDKDLGFDKEQTLILQNPFIGDKEKTARLRQRMQDFAAAQPAISGFTGAGFRYANGFNMNGHTINAKKVMLTDMTVDYNFFELAKIPILQGRAFSPQFATDTSRLNIPKEQLDSLNSQTRSNLVVNETLYNELGHPPLNELNRVLGGFIVGVCQDYFYTGLQQKIGPAYHRCRPDRVGFFWFKLAKGQNIPAVIDRVKAAYGEAANDEDFNYSFMDEDVKKVYESHERWLTVIRFASWMAVLIAGLGLFGLSAIVAVNRTKEIGIRKVLGASVSQLFYALNKQSLLMVAVSILVAVPIANYVAGSWLQNFAYRIPLSWSLFAIAACVGLACALAAVSYHTLRAARANPVKSLRTE